MGVDFAVVEVDKSHAMAAIQRKLGEISKITTVPNLFIQGTSLGGCVDVKARIFHGKLQNTLAPFMTKPHAKDEDIPRHSLFYFPETVNGHVVRFSGLFTSIYAILCCIFYRHMATQWCVLALACDFVLRFTFGASCSVVGMVSAVLVSRIAPKFVAGPPKQFAALCGVFFSTFAAGLYLADQRVGGCVVMALLAAAAGLEGVLDFCLGCWMFGFLIKFGMVSPSVYRPYLSMREEKVWTYNFMHLFRDLPHAVNEHVLLPNQTEPTKVDLIRKKRFELEYKLQDIDLIRHTSVDFFAVPMSIMALAVMFQMTTKRYPVVDFDGGYASQVLAIVAVIFAGLFFILYSMRMIMYPKKVCKEWHHPLQSNYFAAMTITVILFGMFLLQTTTTGGISLIWIGAIGQMALTIFKLSELVYRRWSEDWESPIMMMIPVANLVAAMGFGRYHQEYPQAPNFANIIQYAQLARLWFSVAILFALVYFTITLRRSFHDGKNDVRQRAGLWVWLATAAGIGPAFLAVLQDSTQVAQVGTDVFYQSMWCIALVFFVVLSLGYLRGFFTYTGDLSMWVVPFSLSIFAINTIQYYTLATNPLFLVLSLITGAIACASQAVTGLHTLFLLVDGTLWIPKQKWGPVSFMKLTHEAFRFVLPQFEARIAELSSADGASPATSVAVLDHLLQDLNEFFVVFDEHSRHEDLVLFPLMRRYFPGINADVDADHVHMHETVDAWKALIQRYQTAKQNGAAEQSAAVSNLISVLALEFAPWSVRVQQHLRSEEDTITVIARKYVPLEVQRDLTAQCFTKITSSESWAVVLRFMMYRLPVFQWKIRYLKAFLWAVPERAHEIGLLVHRHVDQGLWLALTQELPEIIPRGVSGYQRIY
jgi:tellurite resistance protein TehA-like permease/glutaredoxin/hemerythrin-like domain-containing protein